MRIFWVFCLFLSISISEAEAANPFRVQVESSDWEVLTDNDYYLRAIYPAEDVEITIFTDKIAPAGGGCKYKERTRNVPMQAAFYKVMRETDNRQDKIIDLSKIRIFMNKDGRHWLKTEVVDQISPHDKWAKDNEKIRLGTLDFVSPYGCSAVEGAEFEIDTIRVNRKKINPLKFKIYFENQVAGGLKRASK